MKERQKKEGKRKKEILHVLYPLQIKNILTPIKMTIIKGTVFIILQITITPLYAVSKLGLKFSPLRNKTIIGRMFIGDGENIEKIAYIINSFIIPMTVFAIIVICTVIPVVTLQNQTHWRKTIAVSVQAHDCHVFYFVYCLFCSILYDTAGSGLRTRAILWQ